MALIHIPEPHHSYHTRSKIASQIEKLKPDVIAFEFPKVKGCTLERFNKFAPNKKPERFIRQWKELYEDSSKQYPWLKAEEKVVNAIVKIWKSGKQVLLFEIDGPIELTSLQMKTSEMWAVWNFIREQYMIKEIKKLSKKYSKKKIVVTCHDQHWKNLRALSSIKTKKKLWNYYFKWLKLTPKQLAIEIKAESQKLYTYWKIHGKF